MDAPTAWDPTKTPTRHNQVTLFRLLTEVVLDREFARRVDYVQGLPVGSYEGRLVVSANPPKIRPPIHGNRAFPLSTHRHRSTTSRRRLVQEAPPRSSRATTQMVTSRERRPLPSSSKVSAAGGS